jgi:molybdopterin converting factor small subunit
MQVKFYATLRYVVGSKMVNINLPDRVTVQQLLDEMLRCYSALRRELVDEQGNLYSIVILLLMGAIPAFSSTPWTASSRQMTASVYFLPLEGARRRL